eukprot:c4925_g1_i1.p1 GENE.c4925_g1_i1~~c4925_g1_i1.p1  ORF type:complete len:1220 (-),score=373.84 c4925_g1_i1:105-3707(-)
MAQPVTFSALEPDRPTVIAGLLEATKAAIEAQGLAFRPTSFMAALVAILNKGSSDETTLDAACYLLAQIVPEVPRQVFQTQFTPIAETFGKVLTARRKHLEIVASLLTASSAILTKLEPAELRSPLALGMFHRLVERSVGSNEPAAKQTAPHVLAVLSLPRCPAQMVTTFVETVSNGIKIALNPSSTSRKTEVHSSPLSVLNVAITSVPALPAQALLVVARTVSKAMGLGNSSVSVLVYVFLEKSFELNTHLTIDQRIQLFELLLSLQPDLGNSALAIKFFSCLRSGFVSVYRPGPECPQNRDDALLHAIQLTTHALLVEDFKVAKHAAYVAKDMLIGSLCDRESKQSLGVPGNVDLLVATVTGAMQLRCKANWSQSLRIVEATLTAFGANSTPHLDSLVVSIGGLYPLIMGTGTEPSNAPHHLRSALTSCLAAAATVMGPSHFLQLFPLEVDLSSGDFTRPWVVPLIRQHTSRPRLGEFPTHVLPVVDRIAALQAKAQSEEKAVLCRSLQWRHGQVWSLLLGYCNHPVDIAESFPKFAKPLADTLTSQPSVRQTIAQALTTLITNAQEDKDSTAEKVPEGHYTVDEATTALATLSKFSRNFLPHLFTLFMTACVDEASDPATPPALLAAISAFSSLADKQLVSGMLRQVVTKILQASASLVTAADVATFDRLNNEKHLLCDLVLPLIPFVDAECADLLLKMAVPQLKDQDNKSQKKAYKITNQVCVHHSEVAKASLAVLVEGVLAAAHNCAPSTRAPRIELLRHVALFHTSENIGDLMPKIAVEIVMGTKDAGKESRDEAFDTVLAIANYYNESFKEQGGMRVYYHMLLAMLGAKDPAVISATILAMARLLYQYHDSEDGEAMISDLFSVSQVLLGHEVKEVIRSTLGLVKMCIRFSNRDKLKQLAPPLVHAMVTASKVNNNRFHQEVKVLLERLGRKFSFNEVLEWVPEADRKFVTHVRKQFERTKRLKKENRSHANFEKDMNDDDDKTKKWKAKKSATDVQLHDTDDAEPMNLLDDITLARSLTKKPTLGKRKADTDAGFSVDETGRIVVDEQPKQNPASMSRETTPDGEPIVTMRDVAKSQAEIASNNKRQRIGEASGVAYNRPNLTSLKNKRLKYEIKHTGSEYAPKANTHAKGDIKRAGKPDPFAYIPLSRLQLNKRFKHKVTTAVQKVTRIGGRKNKLPKSTGKPKKKPTKKL